MQKHTILFLAANPSGTDPLALDREAHAIHVELERSRWRDRFEFVTRWATEPLDLLRELRKLQPTVVHFSGHGERGAPCAPQSVPTLGRDVVADFCPRDGERCEGLFFQDPDGGPKVVSAAALRDVFGAAGSSVTLVVLNACYSEPAAEALLAHVDCVVGMAGSIRSDAARSFAVGLYGGLGESESIEAAHKGGCAAIGLEGLPESDRPRLRVRPSFDAGTLILAEKESALHRSTVKTSHLVRTRARPRVQAVVLFLIASATVVAIALVLYLVPAPAQQFDVTVFLQDEAGVQAPIARNHGRVSLDLGADRRTESVGDKGEVRFYGIPSSMRDHRVALALDADNYELVNPRLEIQLPQEVFYAAVRPKRLPLVGYVFDDHGRPLVRARASIAGNAATTDPDGRFEILLPASLPVNDRTITIMASGYETWRAQATPGGNPLQVRLSASADGR